MLERLSALQAKQTQLQVSCTALLWSHGKLHASLGHILCLHLCVEVSLELSDTSCLPCAAAPSNSMQQLVLCVEQAALDRAETKSEPAQNVSDASNSDSNAGPRKLKQKTKQIVPAAQLLEDEGLNAELDAANTGGMVETERDRLIRIVSTL